MRGLQDQMGSETLSQVSQQVNSWAWKQPLVLVHVTAGDGAESSQDHMADDSLLQRKLSLRVCLPHTRPLPLLWPPEALSALPRPPSLAPPAPGVSFPSGSLSDLTPTSLAALLHSTSSALAQPGNEEWVLLKGVEAGTHWHGNHLSVGPGASVLPAWSGQLEGSFVPGQWPQVPSGPVSTLAILPGHVIPAVCPAASGFQMGFLPVLAVQPLLPHPVFLG